MVAGGPALPALPGVARAKSVTAVLKVNGAIAKCLGVRICPVMPSDPGTDDPCAHSEPRYDVTTDDKGVLTWSDVVAGTYAIAFMAKTSQGKTQWAVVRGALDVQAGSSARLPPIDVRLSELSCPY